jgi:hypothetical protein
VLLRMFDVVKKLTRGYVSSQWYPSLEYLLNFYRLATDNLLSYLNSFDQSTIQSLKMTRGRA